MGQHTAEVFAISTALSRHCIFCCRGGGGARYPDILVHRNNWCAVQCIDVFKQVSRQSYSPVESFQKSVLPFLSISVEIYLFFDCFVKFNESQIVVPSGISCRKMFWSNSYRLPLTRKQKYHNAYHIIWQISRYIANHSASIVAPQLHEPHFLCFSSSVVCWPMLHMRHLVCEWWWARQYALFCKWALFLWTFLTYRSWLFKLQISSHQQVQFLDETGAQVEVQIAGNVDISNLAGLGQEIIGELDPNTGIVYTTRPDQSLQQQRTVVVSTTPSLIGQPQIQQLPSENVRKNLVTTVSNTTVSHVVEADHSATKEIISTSAGPKSMDFLTNALSQADIDLDTYQLMEEQGRGQSLATKIAQSTFGVIEGKNRGHSTGTKSVQNAIVSVVENSIVTSHAVTSCTLQNVVLPAQSVTSAASNINSSTITTTSKGPLVSILNPPPSVPASSGGVVNCSVNLPVSIQHSSSPALTVQQKNNEGESTTSPNFLPLPENLNRRLLVSKYTCNYN